jgi:hypothetical protein
LVKILTINTDNRSSICKIEWLYDKSIKSWFVPPPYDKISGPFGISPDSSKWGEPYFYSDFTGQNRYIKDQQLIINITLCGGWAGNQTIWNQMCPSKVNVMIIYIPLEQ